ncbi:MAG: type III PLP-dependent enzyme [Inquilinus sp.]|nr:type III PLP-dependent enzyme [Inquilinus sp.]
MIDSFDTAAEMAARLEPEEPVYCLRPHVISATARRFVTGFPGDVLYAVKCNDNPIVLQAIHDGGVRHFDTASVAEVAEIAGHFPEQTSHYMHPVKSQRSIEEAYFHYGVRSFAVDHPDELEKLLEVTGGRDLTVVVRVQTPRNMAVFDLGGKFGASVEEAAELLRAASAPDRRLGLTFHVGSQCLNPDAYRRAIKLAGRVLRLARVPIDILDVGGGFPVAYAGVDVPPLEDFFAAIDETATGIRLPEGCRLLCEPGRSMVAEGCSIVVRVTLRRSDSLYLNDGIYGGLSDLTFNGIDMPMRVIRAIGGKPRPAADPDNLAAFRLFGPTCDSGDKLPRPYLLDAGVADGDWIEIGQAGAYSNVLATRFNGFQSARTVLVRDDAFRPGPADRHDRQTRQAAE